MAGIFKGKIFWLLCLLVCTTGCTTLFLQPSKRIYPFVLAEKIPYDDFNFHSEDGTKLNGWYFHSEKVCAQFKDLCHWRKPARGVVVQFHGNAENMGSHFRSVIWLALEGYDIFTFDYRAYGRSEGSKNMRGVVEDTHAAINWILAKAPNANIYLYGQSLGGSLMLRAMQDRPRDTAIKAIVVESSFYSYQGIAREKLAGVWLTWPLQWLAYVLISNRWSPGRPELAKLSPTPVLLIYSTDDPVVPVQHGEKLFAGLAEPKYFWKHDNFGHINSMFVENKRYRTQLIEYFVRSAK